MYTENLCTLRRYYGWATAQNCIHLQQHHIKNQWNNHHFSLLFFSHRLPSYSKPFSTYPYPLGCFCGKFPLASKYKYVHIPIIYIAKPPHFRSLTFYDELTTRLDSACATKLWRKWVCISEWKRLLVMLSTSSCWTAYINILIIIMIAEAA